MLKKAIAAIAVAGSLLVLAPHAALADEARERPVATADEGITDRSIATTNAKRDAIAQQALSDIEQRLANDPALVEQLRTAAAKGDTLQASKLLASDGAEVLAVSTEAGGGAGTEALRVTIRVSVTVCVTVWGTTYCGTITVTINLN